MTPGPLLRAGPAAALLAGVVLAAGCAAPAGSGATSGGSSSSAATDPLAPPSVPDPPPAASGEPIPEQPTFAEHVAPVLYEHCVPCHRPGGAGPFSLVTYEEVRKRARQLDKVLRTGFMPPWLPAPVSGPFRGDRTLPEAQRALIRAWLRKGAPLGDAGRIPEPPVFADAWQLGTPDLVVSFPEPYVLQADGPDVFRNFVLRDVVQETRYVRAIEFIPDNPKVIHHAVFGVDRTESSRRRDEEDPGPGYSGMHPEGLQSPDGFFLGWVPGRAPDPGDPRRAWRLDSKADLIIQLHMLPSGKPEPVRPELGLYFADEPPSQIPFMIRLGTRVLDIPPGAADYETHDLYRLPVDVEVLAVGPHAHYLGKDMKGFATLPDGTKRWLIWIPDWDFNWQDEYHFLEPVHLPKGTWLAMRFTYDNTAGNPRNPHDPPRRVRFGPSTYDEMGDLWIQVLPVDPGDRDVLARHYAAFDLEREIRRYQALVELEPDSRSRRNNLGNLYMRAGRLAEARGAFEAALRVDPTYALAQRNLAAVLFNLGDYRAALEGFARAARLDPDDADTQRQWGEALAAVGRMDEAIRAFRRAVALKPAFPQAWFSLGRASRMAGDWDGALEAFEEAHRQEPSWAAAAAELARTLSMHPEGARRDPGRALRLAREASASAGDADPQLLETLAIAHAAAGDFDGARRVLERALALARGPGAQRLRARLEERRQAFIRGEPPHLAHHRTPRG